MARGQRIVRVGLYARVSTQDQKTLPMQVRTLRTYVRQRGGASVAGAKLQLVWEYLSHSFAHRALVAGTTPDNKYIDTVVHLAQRGALFLFDLGYFKMKALAQIAEAEAYFLTRHQHQATLFAAVAGRLCPVELTAWLRTEAQPLVERPLYLGAHLTRE